VRVNGSPRLSSVAEFSRRAHTARSALIRASDDAQHTRALPLISPAFYYPPLMLNIHRCVVGVVAVLLVSGVASAQTSADIAALRVEANAGDANAQYNLGVMYETGHGVPEDYAQAVSWFRQAADQGLAGAQFNLGVMYRNGDGVPQDYAQAVAWYRQAAEQRDADAQLSLGNAYHFGQGVSQDYAQAVSWYRQAADQGLAGAQYSLGYAYEAGQGVPQDYVEAHKWRNLAAFRASAENQKSFGRARDLMATVMTPAQIADAQTLAREWQAAFDARQE
jgi:TPR repeat protein